MARQTTCSITLFSAPPISGSRPVARVEGAAHAQRLGRDVEQFVSWHFLAGFGQNFNRRVAWGGAGLLSLVRPFCLAGVCRTGYRKE